MLKLLISNTTTLAALSCAGQFVTVDQGRYGLIDLDGSQILESEWDKVELISEAGNIYRYDRNGLSGIYAHDEKLLLPCRYEVNALSDAAFSLCAEGQCGLLAGISDKNGSWKYSWTGELWTELYEINSRYTGARNDSLYGVLSIESKVGDTIVPFVSIKRVFRDNLNGFLSSDSRGNVILYAPGSTEKCDVEIVTRAKNAEVHRHLVVFYSENNDSLTCLDYRDGSLLSAYGNNTKEGLRVLYDREWQCIYRESRMSRNKSKLELINPYTGQVLCTEIANKNARLFFGSDPQPRNMDRPEVVRLREDMKGKTIDTNLGEITGYEYTPYENRTFEVKEIEVIRDKKLLDMPRRRRW